MTNLSEKLIMSDGLREQRGISKYRDKIVNGPIIRTILWLGIPPLFNQLVFVTYNLADSFWLSRYSELMVAVPRQVWPVIMLFQALVMALTAACLSIVSQYVGGKAYKKANLEASRFFTVSFLAGATLSAALLALRGPIFTWVIFTPPEICEAVLTYSGVVAFDVFFNYIAIMYTTLLQSVGDTRRPAIINAVSVIINMIFDPFLVLGIGPFPRLGVVGAAVTDVMGKILSIIGQTYILRRNYPELKIKFTKDVDVEWARLVLKISLPILTLGLMNGFSFLLQLRLVNEFGIVVTTAFSIGFIIMNIVDSALFGLSGAPAIMIGQSLGADKPKRAREVALKAALMVFIIMAVGAGALYPLKRVIADLFVDDLYILNETELYLQTLLPSLPFFGLFITSLTTGRGSGHTIFPTSLDIVRHWGITITLSYFLAFIVGMGPLGIWMAFSLSNVIAGTISIIWIKYGNWAKAVVKRDPA